MDKKIPDGWQIVNFGDVINKINDKVPNRDEWTLDKFVSGGHIDSERVRVTKFSPIIGNEEKIGSAFHMRFQPGHVLYVSRRAYLRKGGMVDFEGICSNTTFIIQADESRLLQSLVPFIIQTEDFVKHTTDNSHGSTNPFLNWKDIAKYRLLLPPLEEQKKISEVLWAIEDNIVKNECLISITEALKKGLLHKLLTKGIGHEKFKETEIGEIPEEWDTKELVDFTKPKCDSFYDGDWILSEDLKTGNDVRLIQLSDIGQGVFLNKSNKYISNHRCKELNCFLLQEGDVVISRMAEPVARSFIVPKLEETWITAVDVCIARVNESIANKEYLNYLMNSDYS